MQSQPASAGADPTATCLRSLQRARRRPLQLAHSKNSRGFIPSPPHAKPGACATSTSIHPSSPPHQQKAALSHTQGTRPNSLTGHGAGPSPAGSLSHTGTLLRTTTFSALLAVCLHSVPGPNCFCSFARHSVNYDPGSVDACDKVAVPVHIVNPVLRVCA